MGRDGRSESGRSGTLLLVSLLLLSAGQAAAQDDVALIVETTAAPGEVQLAWTGGLPTYRVFRAEAAATIIDPGHEIGSTPAQAFVDLPPEAPVLYYLVASCVFDPPERCDGIDNDCDGAVDGPGSEDSCNLANATPECIEGGCEIVACDPYFHDLDGSAGNGCECRSDVDEPTPFQANVLASGRYLGTFNDCDWVQALARNLVPTADTEDFYRFYMQGNVLCNFDLRASLTVPSGTNYDLYLYKWNSGAWSLLRSSTNAGNASEQLSCGGCDILCGGCGCTGCSTDGDYGVRVVRAGGAPTTCGAYSLSIQEQ